jgi:hypothetical protein
MNDWAENSAMPGNFDDCIGSLIDLIVAYSIANSTFQFHNSPFKGCPLICPKVGLNAKQMIQ